MERQLDAREAKQVIEPIDRLKGNAKRATPAPEWTGHCIDLWSRCRRPEDGVDHGSATAKGKPCTWARLIEQAWRLDRFITEVHRQPAMTDDGEAIILLDHVAGEVAARPKLHQGCGGAAAHGVDFVRGKDGHGGVHRSGPFGDPNFCSGYGRERSVRGGVTPGAIGSPI